MKKSILMLDCDGTCIFTADSTMTDFTYDILYKAQQQFYLVFNTGRNLSEFFDVIGKDKIIGDFVIGLNGKILYDLKNNKYIHAPSDDEFTLQEIQKILNIANKYNCIESSFFEKTYRYEECQDVTLMKNVIKYIARSYNQVALEKMFCELKNEFNDCFCELARVGGKTEKWIELWKSKSSKKDLVPMLLKQLPNIDTFYYFGDSDNDLEVIQLADIKIVPQNAISELKNIADIVLPENCDQNAVAKHIQTLIK